MRNMLTSLLLVPAMILAAPACMSQARDGDGARATPAAPDAVPARDRSAFGRVMAVMIDALQQEARQQPQGSSAAASASADAGVRTTAIGTPLGIEVGDAFRLDAQQPRAGASAPLAVHAGQAD